MVKRKMRERKARKKKEKKKRRHDQQAERGSNLQFSPPLFLSSSGEGIAPKKAAPNQADRKQASAGERVRREDGRWLKRVERERERERRGKS